MTDTTTTTTDSPKKKSKARLITPILALVAVLGIGIFGGIIIGQNTASATTAGGRGDFAGGPGGATSDGTAPTGGGMGGLTAGSVVSVDGDTVVIESSDGTQVTVTTSTDTTVTTTEDSSVGQLAEGDTVTVMGETDDDGNVTATSISEGATGFGGGGFGGGGTPPTTDSE